MARAIADILKTIPHLRLDIPVPLDDIRSELREHVDDYPAVTLNHSIRGRDPSEFIPNWFGRGLVDYLPDSRTPHEYLAVPSDRIRRGPDGSLSLWQTELALKMNETLRFIRSFTAIGKGICRILRLPPHQLLPWHSHARFRFLDPMPYHKLVLQIPILTSEKVSYRVAELNRTDGPRWEQSYRAGEVWVFNSWHEHSVENLGDEDRITLYVESFVDDRLLSPILADAVAQYQGPFLSSE